MEERKTMEDSDLQPQDTLPPAPGFQWLYTFLASGPISLSSLLGTKRSILPGTWELSQHLHRDPAPESNGHNSSSGPPGEARPYLIRSAPSLVFYYRAKSPAPAHCNVPALLTRAGALGRGEEVGGGINPCLRI